MENRERVIELFLALIFVAILLLAVVFVLTESNNSNQRTVNTISNSYNTNSYNSYVQKPKKIEPIYLDKTVLRKTYYEKDYFEKKYYEKERYLDYSSYGKHTQRKDFIGSYVDDFRVYVVNKEFSSGYFKVKFYFEDSSGKKFVETVDHHVRAGEKKEFKFVDVQFEKYKYSDWNYKVIPETKSFDEKYYVITKKIIY